MKTTILAAALVGAALTAKAQTPAGPILSLTATSSNVAGAPDSIKIDLFRWSTDAERDQFFAAWTNPNASASTPAAPRAGASPDAAGRGGRGGGRAASAGRGGRGAAKGATEAPATPESALTAALGKTPTIGYLWSSEVAGYSVRSAVKLTQPDGSARILLITDRRLGALNDLWKLDGPDATTTYEFSVVELHLNSKGQGEGKVSLTGKVVPDSAAKTIALDNYDVLPVILKNVRRK